MKNRIIISDEAESVFKEIIENENTPNYWKNRFENLSNRDDMILRGCFKELRESGLIHVQWADNYPYFIQILKDGYLYEEKKEQEERLGMSQFEKELYDLLKRADSIQPPANTAPEDFNLHQYNRKRLIIQRLSF